VGEGKRGRKPTPQTGGGAFWGDPKRGRKLKGNGPAGVNWQRVKSSAPKKGRPSDREERQKRKKKTWGTEKNTALVKDGIENVRRMGGVGTHRKKKKTQDKQRSSRSKVSDHLPKVFGGRKRAQKWKILKKQTTTQDRGN